jgi:hypothetical protein
MQMLSKSIMFYAHMLGMMLSSDQMLMLNITLVNNSRILYILYTYCTQRPNL